MKDGGSHDPDPAYPARAHRAIFLLTMVAVAACQDNGPDVPVVGAVSVSPPTAAIDLGRTVQLTATVTDAAGHPLTGHTVIWSSSDTVMAPVSVTGLVTARIAGVVTITAASEGKSGDARITVTSVTVASVTVTPPVDTLGGFPTVQLTATPRDSAGNELFGRPIQWVADNSYVAEVSGTGLVTGIAAGKTGIHATVGNRGGVATIVVPPVAAVMVGAATTAIAVGHRLRAVSIVFDSMGNVPDWRAVTWSSANPNVAVVSPNGLVTGVSAGTVTITATSEGVKGDGVFNISGPALVFASISAGNHYTCGVTTAGAGFCWGENGTGQLGDGSTTASITPLEVAGGHTFSQISTGWTHTCGLTTSGAGYCWGDGQYGQLGDGTMLAHLTPMLVSGGITFGAVSVGGSFSCGVTPASKVYCWGVNNYTQLGDPSLGPMSVPTPLPGGLTLQMLSAGGGGACGVTAAAAAYCWGYGVGAPAAVEGGLSFTTLSTGTSDRCGVTQNHDVYCWSVGSSPPTIVPGRLSFASVSVWEHYCGVTTGNAAWCWGQNPNGGLGDGTNGGSPTPVAVAGGVSFAAVSTGYFHTCGVSTSGVAYCWGDGSSGQVGSGNRAYFNTLPVKVAGQP